MTKSAVPELTTIVRQVVAASPGDRVRERIGRAARFLGITPRRVKSWVYGEVADASVDEADRIRAKAKEWRRRQAGAEAELAALNTVIAQGVADNVRGGARRLARRGAARGVDAPPGAICGTR